MCDRRGTPVMNALRHRGSNEPCYLVKRPRRGISGARPAQVRRLRSQSSVSTTKPQQLFYGIPFCAPWLASSKTESMDRNQRHKRLGLLEEDGHLRPVYSSQFESPWHRDETRQADVHRGVADGVAGVIAQLLPIRMRFNSCCTAAVIASRRLQRAHGTPVISWRRAPKTVYSYTTKSADLPTASRLVAESTRANAATKGIRGSQAMAVIWTSRLGLSGR